MLDELIVYLVVFLIVVLFSGVVTLVVIYSMKVKFIDKIVYKIMNKFV